MENLQLVPAAQLFAAFNGGAPSWMWRPKDINPGGSIRAYLTSKPESGWRYYNKDRDAVLSTEYPENWEENIGYAFGHGPGKVDKETGQPKEDKDYPRRICLARLWIVETKEMVAAVIDSKTLQGRLAQICDNPGFGMLCNAEGTMVSNFYLQFFHNKNVAPAMTYMVDGHLRPTQDERVWIEAAKPWYPEQFWQGLNPFEAPTTPPPNAGKPALPSTAFDDHGAEHEIAPETPDDDSW